MCPFQQVKREHSAGPSPWSPGTSRLKTDTVELPEGRKNKRTLSRETLRYVKVHAGQMQHRDISHDLVQIFQPVVFPVGKIFASC